MRRVAEKVDSRLRGNDSKRSNGEQAMYWIEAATPHPDFTVTIKWRCGAESTVDFSPTIAKGGVCEPMADPAFFIGKMHIDEDGRSLGWPEEVDFCADSLWYRTHLEDLKRDCDVSNGGGGVRMMEAELRFVRIHATGIKYGNPIWFDVLISGDNKIISGMEFGGHEVLIKGEQKETHPFVLLKDGRLDFGGSYNEKDRYAVTNIRETEITIGHCFNSKYEPENTDEYFLIRKFDFEGVFTSRYAGYGDGVKSMSDYRMIRVHLECFELVGPWDKDLGLERWPMWFDVIVDENNLPVRGREGYYFGGHKYHDNDKSVSESRMVPALLNFDTGELEQYVWKYKNDEVKVGLTGKLDVGVYYLRNFINRRIEITALKSNSPDHEKNLKSVVLECKNYPELVSLYNIIDFGVPV